PRCSVLFHFGETDQSIPPDHHAKIRAAHPEIPMHIYPAGHGFNCDARGSYDAASATLARTRTMEFLAKHLPSCPESFRRPSRARTPDAASRPRARRAARTSGARLPGPARLMSPRQASDTRRLVVELGAAALARFFLNIARRFAYPFAPALARGLEVPLTQVTSLVAINQGSGLLS